MFKRTVLGTAILFGLAACSDTPMVPEANVTPLGVSSGGGGAPKIMICHLDAEVVEPDADGPGWELLEVNSKSLDKHLAHGDAQPGDDYREWDTGQDVPDFVFGADCQPEYVPPPPVSEGCSAVNNGEWNQVLTSQGAQVYLSRHAFFPGEVLSVAINVTSDNSGGGAFYLDDGPIDLFSLESGVGPHASVDFTGEYEFQMPWLWADALLTAGNGTGSVTTTSTVTCTPAP